ncbi:hypothetical protein HAX54_015540, partial [Datura stramonium]|nr:hypothetical protein [Datura stramonium]
MDLGSGCWWNIGTGDSGMILDGGIWRIWLIMGSRSIVVVLGVEVVGTVGNDGKCSCTSELRDGKRGGGLLVLRG